jgi:hypothetical protein
MVEICYSVVGSIMHVSKKKKSRRYVYDAPILLSIFSKKVIGAHLHNVLTKCSLLPLSKKILEVEKDCCP